MLVMLGNASRAGAIGGTLTVAVGALDCTGETEALGAAFRLADQWIPASHRLNPIPSTNTTDQAMSIVQIVPLEDKWPYRPASGLPPPASLGSVGTEPKVRA